MAGVTTSGLAVARKILKCRTADLLGQHGPELQIYPAEDISQWPEKVQSRLAQQTRPDDLFEEEALLPVEAMA